MTTDTDAHICYGILLAEDVELPWDSEEAGGDLETWWWYGVCKFKHSFESYNTDPGDYTGNRYLPGVTPDDVTRYHKEYSDFRLAHPCPVCLINAQHHEYPLYILASTQSGMVLSASRGNPTAFDPAMLIAQREDADVLTKFCIQHEIDTAEETPKWWLSSYWG